MDRKQYMRQYQHAWMKARRSKWLEENGPCVKCGSSLNLEVDHIDPKTKTMSPAAIWSRKESIRLEELAKCQVLCEICHQAKTTKEQRTYKHGTYAMRNTWGCKCEECLEYVRMSKRKSREKLALKNNGM